ncbi:homing endonuclease associated repeat-containing protein [Halorubellus salinus]|uniref:homing endonuclease associated repeat-containing protein n=1 Tax=Halorubellus salinus TaxID=755309 RepID=UPI001D065C15
MSTATDTDSTPSPSVDTRELLLELLRVHQTVTGVPTREDLDKHTDYGADTYAVEFGSIDAALDAAGITTDT